MNTKKISTRELVLTALFTAFIAVGAFIKIPIPYIPFTMQTFFVMMAGLILGPKYGTLSTILYLILGLIGLPIFTQGGGLSYIFVPSFGYIIGFVFASLVIGLIAGKKSYKSIKYNILANIIGLITLYIFGMIYFYLIMKFHFKIEKSASYIIINLFLIFLPSDLILSILAAYICVKLKPYLNYNKNIDKKY